MQVRLRIAYVMAKFGQLLCIHYQQYFLTARKLCSFFRVCQASVLDCNILPDLSFKPESDTGIRAQALTEMGIAITKIEKLQADAHYE